MPANSALGSMIVQQDLRVNRLLTEATLVGGIYTMGYNEALVLTNDLWKQRAGGIPQHCFLLATAIEPDSTPDADDEEVILMRVVGPAPLPAEAELVQVRADAMRDMVLARGREGAMASPAIIDVLTRNEIQFSAVKVKVIGTFYEKQIGPDSILTFGSDIETYYAASRYKVYKPFGSSLSIIASYPELTEKEERRRQETGAIPSRVRIGSVRYSSTTRRRDLATTQGDTVAVPVSVNAEDFISMKTAFFGMTRLGKSNGMKTIATAVFQHAAETGQPVGQLLFDPAGEYANINQQDQTALSALGPDYVTIFRFGADSSDPGIRPLSTNFFSDETVAETWSIIKTYLAANNNNIRYIDNFLNTDIIGPASPDEDRSLYNRARRRRALFYGCLLKADFMPPDNFRARLVVNAGVLAAINSNKARSNIADFVTGQRGSLELDATRLREWCDSVVSAKAAIRAEDAEWIDTNFESILDIYSSAQGVGYLILRPLIVYHGLGTDTDYAEDIYQELVAGKIVIIDLSLGSETILKYCSERIITHIIQNGAARFADGEHAYKIQIFLEEAHRLFNRDGMKVKAESDPYVRLAKEAAKYEIGLVYATQEVSSVDPLILSNTSNWIVAHLNNHSEVRELAKYYDFEDFSEMTINAEDVGFVRVKTRSGRYIIPTQIDLFTQASIDGARAAADGSDLAPMINSGTVARGNNGRRVQVRRTLRGNL